MNEDFKLQLYISQALAQASTAARRGAGVTGYGIRLSFGFLQHRIVRSFFTHGLVLRFDALDTLIQFTAQPIQLIMALLTHRAIFQ
jgi:hypothetical protein